MTPAQSHKIAQKLLEITTAVREAQRAYQRTYNAVHKLSGDVEAKRIALENLQSAYLVQLGNERDFEQFERSRKKLTRTESAYATAAERFAKAQDQYDKEKGAKNVKELQAAREQLDKLKPKIGKDTGEFYRSLEVIHEIAASTRTSTQLEKAQKAYEQAVQKHQKTLPKLSKARMELQKAWDEQHKYLQSLRRKKQIF